MLAIAGGGATCRPSRLSKSLYNPEATRYAAPISREAQNAEPDQSVATRTFAVAIVARTLPVCLDRVASAANSHQEGATETEPGVYGVLVPFPDVPTMVRLS